jgi:hypothetical protein
MPDNKNEIGKPDRDRVSADERYEVALLAQKFGKSIDFVESVIRRFGPMRSDVEAQLARPKRK